MHEYWLIKRADGLYKGPSEFGSRYYARCYATRAFARFVLKRMRAKGHDVKLIHVRIRSHSAIVAAARDFVRLYGDGNYKLMFRALDRLREVVEAEQ
jgi:hypothetical protein